jgi:predicted DNA-binding antitoxin AbrB/MazE fold protein
MDTIDAVYAGGVFRPTGPITLAENSRVKLKIVNGALEEPISHDMDAIYEILSHRHNSGHTDTAARHNEHQP